MYSHIYSLFVVLSVVKSDFIYIYIYICMIYMYVYKYIYIYIYTHTHTHTHIHIYIYIHIYIFPWRCKSNYTYMNCFHGGVNQIIPVRSDCRGVTYIRASRVLYSVTTIGALYMVQPPSNTDIH